MRPRPASSGILIVCEIVRRGAPIVHRPHLGRRERHAFGPERRRACCRRRTAARSPSPPTTRPASVAAARARCPRTAAALRLTRTVVRAAPAGAISRLVLSKPSAPLTAVGGRQHQTRAEQQRERQRDLRGGETIAHPVPMPRARSPCARPRAAIPSRRRATPAAPARARRAPSPSGPEAAVRQKHRHAELKIAASRERSG